METNTVCPIYSKCPIYLKNVFKNKRAGESYRQVYCTAGESMYRTCKRFITTEITGKPVPETIMPNSSMSIEQIIEKILNQ